MLEKGLYMAFNFFSSVSIITINKIVFTTYGYKFSTFLTGLHFIVTFVGLLICSSLNVFQIKYVGIRHVLPLSLSFVGFVVFNNLSLQYNSIGFYQLMKVLTTPVIVVIQLLLFGVALHNRLKVALIPICVGVAMATVSDVEVNMPGTIFAVAGIISTSMYQIWVKSKQQDLQLDSYQLLFLQAPTSALLVFILSFMFEPWFGENSITSYDYTFEAMTAIGASCLLAFLVNLSIFMVIGRTSPVAYNVLGHFKLCVILISGFLLFGEDTNAMKLAGTLLAFSGVVWYTHVQQSIPKGGWDNREAAAKNGATAGAVNGAAANGAAAAVNGSSSTTRDGQLYSKVATDDRDTDVELQSITIGDERTGRN